MILRIASFVLVLQGALLATDATIPGYEGQTKAVIQRALKAYRALESYQDKLVVRTEIDVEGDESIVAPQGVSQATLAWARPNRIALDTPVYAVFSDGKKLWQHMKHFEQYIESRAPDPIDLAKSDLHDLGAYERARHPIASIIGRPSASATDLFGKITKFTGIRPEPLAAKPGKSVSGLVERELQEGKKASVPFDAWFSDQTGLLGEIRYDYTEQARTQIALDPRASGKVKINKFLRRFRFEKIAPNAKLADDNFVFKPTPYDEKVAQFRSVTHEEWQRKLIGRPAPSFSGKDMEGKGIILSDFKGRVVLLDFWASHCGPCIMIMPIIQKLADQFADKPVSAIGINGDPPAKARWAAYIVASQKVKYRQYLDVDHEVFTAYRIMPIPCFFIIDRKGVIRTIHMGFTPGDDKKLAQQIETLLKGETLPSP